MDEFALIRKFFQRPPRSTQVALGVGDDAALIDPGPGRLALTTDTLVAGVHFFADANGYDVGHKALAVNLSDLAAMGARPHWFLLNLAVPGVEEAWLEAFSQGLWAVASAFAVDLVGGDTVRGPLSVTITAIGTLPAGGGLRRDGARAGDRIYITGSIGAAALGFYSRSGQITLPEAVRRRVVARLDRPWPRVAEGLGLQGLASAAIDISDGLVADLNHVLVASGVGADIDLLRLPLAPAYDSWRSTLGWDPALAFGDDYELCFTLPPDRLPALHHLMSRFRCGCHYIGDITAAPGLRLHDANGLYTPKRGGFNHFGG